MIEPPHHRGRPVNLSYTVLVDCSGIPVHRAGGALRLNSVIR